MRGIKRTGLDTVRNYLFDLDGCIWFGRRLAPGAAQLIGNLRECGLKAYFLTNISGAGSTKVAEKLNELGIDADPESVLAPLDVAARHPALAGRSQAFVIGTNEVREVLAAAGILPVTHSEDIDIVLVGRDPELTYRQLAQAAQILDRGGKLLALNLDLRVPSHDGGFVPGNGAIVAALTAATGAKPEVIGKPSTFFFREALKTFGVAPAETAMVGDSIDSDIAGGVSVGLVTVLVGEGVGLEASGARPDVHVKDLLELRDLIAGGRK